MAEGTTVIIKDENVNPVDSIATLRDRMMDPAAFGSCSPRQMGVCLGCKAFDRCEEAEKGKRQPLYYGARHIKAKARGGGVREQVMPCFILWSRVDVEKASGSILKIVATHPDAKSSFQKAKTTVTEKGSEPMYTVPNPHEPSKPLPAKDSPYRNCIRTVAVPEWAGVDKDLRLLDAAYAAAILKQEADEQELAREREIIEQAAPNTRGVPEGAEQAFAPLAQNEQEPAGDGKPKRR